MYQILFVVVVVSSVIGLLRGLSKKIPLLKTFSVSLIIGSIVFMWSLSFTLLTILGGLSISDAIYWIIVSTVGAEPLREAPTDPMIQNILLIDAVSSFILLAFIITLIVESFTRKAMEAYKRERGGIGKHVNWRDHIVIVGWTRASESAYEELQRITHRKYGIVIVDTPENIEKIKDKMGEPPSNVEFIGGDPCDDKTLESANIHNAKSVIISLDDDSRSALALLHIKQVLKKHSDELKESGRGRVNVVVEVLRDENEPLIRNAGVGEYINTIVVVSRSLIGRLFASAILEPSVLAFMCDSTSATYGVTAFDEVEAREIIGDQPVKYGEIQKKLLEESDRSKRKLILAVIRRSEKGLEKILPPKEHNLYNMEIRPEDKLIVLRYEEATIEKGYVDLGVELGFKINEYEWVRPGSFDKLWREIIRESGHISIIGWSEATESFIDEVVNIHKALGKIVDGRLSPGYRFEKTLILLSSKKEISGSGLEDVVVVYGDYTSLASLRRVGVSTADIIVVSIGEDDKTTHTLLHIFNLFKSKSDKSLEGGRFKRPIIIAETVLKRTAELILDNDLADVVIASRCFAGRVLAYAALDPAVYSFLADVASGTHGMLDLREIDASVIIERMPHKEKTISFSELFEHMVNTLNMIPLGIITKHGNEDTIIYIPKPDRKISGGEKIIALAYYT